MDHFKGLFITKNKEWGDRLTALLTDINLHLTIVAEWKRSFQEQQHYHYIFADLNAVKEPQQLQIGSASVLIGLTDHQDFDVVREWLVSGAKDVIVFPDEADRLQGLVKVTNKQLIFQREAESGLGTGKVYSFYSAKGGSGKTLLAALTAQSLSVHHKQKVAVIDLNAQYGNIDVLFGCQPIRSYYDLIPVIDEMDIRHLQNISHYHEESGVTLINGPSDPTKAELISDELISKLITVARNQFDYVILDVPSQINNITFTGLTESNLVHYVLTPDSMGLRSYKYAAELFSKFHIGGDEGLSILINRYHPKSELSKKDIEKIIDVDTAAAIRSDYFAIQPNINMGTVFYKKRKDKGTTKLSRDIKDYVDGLVRDKKR